MNKQFKFSEEDIEEIKKKWLFYIEESKNKIKEFKQKTKKIINENFYFKEVKKEKKVFKKDIFKIYFVAGIFHNKIKTKKWKEFFNEKFPNLKKEYFDDIFYFYLEDKKINKIILNFQKSLEKDIEENYQKLEKENKKIIIFAHSFGGILSKTAIWRLPKKYQNKIILVTLATPHNIEYLKVKEVKENLKTPEDLENIKFFTFGGVYDWVVPVKFTHTKSSIKVDFLSEHLMFLYSRDIMEKIFKEVFRG